MGHQVDDTSAKLSGSGAASNVGSITLKGSVGPLLQAEYLTTDRAGFYLRFAVDRYKVTNATINGHEIAIGINWYF